MRGNFHLEAHLCFSQARYKVLMRALRFDDKSQREKRFDIRLGQDVWVDKFVHLREVNMGWEQK